MKTYKLIILSALLMTVSSTLLFAQGAPPATPIDGGLSLLLAAGGAYGLKKLYNRRK
ncbi:MAG: hypothetical protein ACI8TA_001056 [Cyclobacteriaceae bacterium]|jgi:hypothetical protein